MIRPRFWMFGIAALTLLGAAADAGDNPKKQIKDKYSGKTLYLQHNLAHEAGEAHWWNLIEASDLLPLGTPVILKKASSDELVLETEDGRRVEIDCDEVRPSITVVADRILGTAPPTTDDFTAAEREAIEAARIEVGMSRRAAFLAIGYPPFFASSRRLDRRMVSNADLDAAQLIWIKYDHNVLAVTFEGDTISAIGE